MKHTKSFGFRILHFYSELPSKLNLPKDVVVMNPYSNTDVWCLVTTFFTKYFSDARPRIPVFGINPGRHGAGLTGVTFTDPFALAEYCGIKNTLPTRREPSADFIYRFIENWGDAKKFYRDFFLTAVSPLGYTKHGKNYNFYDDPETIKSLTPFIVDSIKKQLALGINREVAIVLGAGKLKKFFLEINAEHGFFKNVHFLEHPRFIMQYRRKHLKEFIKKYKTTFACAITESRV